MLLERFTIDLISEKLENFFDEKSLGNREDPVEEIIFLIISQRTRIENAKEIFNELIKKYPTISDLALANSDDLKKILSKYGRGKKRVEAIIELSKFFSGQGGSQNFFDPSNSDKETFEKLLELPGVGSKVASCTMIYSLQRYSYFPVDSNTIRIFKRLGLIDMSETDHHAIQKNLARKIPKEITKKLHVELVIFGKKICRSQRPLCSICPLNDICPKL